MGGVNSSRIARFTSPIYRDSSISLSRSMIIAKPFLYRFYVGDLSDIVMFGRLAGLNERLKVQVMNRGGDSFS
jgi:hypothetical protein